MKLKVKVSPKHPTGNMWRCRMEFGRKMRTVEVTQEQAADIAADPMLVIAGEIDKEGFATTTVSKKRE